MKEALNYTHFDVFIYHLLKEPMIPKFPTNNLL